MALVLLTGGARSGKSAAAQRLALARSLDGARVVVAVFATASEGDAEMCARIARHRADRPDCFEVCEVSDARGLLGEVGEDALLVVDCLGTALGQLFAACWEEAATGVDFTLADPEALPDGLAEGFELAADALVGALAARAGDTIVVTNEVGSGVVPAYATGRLFRDVLGRANAALAARADAAWLSVAGRLIALHDLPRDAAWPTD